MLELINRKGFSSIVLIIVLGVIALGGGVGFRYFQDKKVSQVSGSLVTESETGEKKVFVPPEIVTIPQDNDSKSDSVQITKNGFLLTGELCVINYQLIPQSEENARRLLNLCEIIVPKIEAKFGRGPNAPPYRIEFYTPRPEDKGTGNAPRAYAANDTVTLSTDFWYTKFPEDAGILAHELTHVVQAFYGYFSEYEYLGINWLVEALADYGEYIAGYSEDLEKNCYHFLSNRKLGVFSCTFQFLKFVEEKYDPEISGKFYKVLRSPSANIDDLFAQYTGKTIGQLINECSQELSCGGVDPL